MDKLTKLLFYAAKLGLTLKALPDGRLEIHGPREAEPLVKLLFKHKAEVMRVLRVQDMLLNLPLEAFGKGLYAMRLFSPEHGELWFISSPQAATKLGVPKGSMTFTAKELEQLCSLNPSTKEANLILAAKKHLNAKILEH
jgi:hypothetical protein